MELNKLSGKEIDNYLRELFDRIEKGLDELLKLAKEVKADLAKENKVDSEAVSL